MNRAPLLLLPDVPYKGPFVAHLNTRLNSDLRFKTLVSHGSDLIVIIDQAGFFQYTSENVSVILGFDHNFFVGKNAFDFIHKDDRESVFMELHKVIDKDDSAQGIQHRFLNSKGGWTWLESKGSNHLSDGLVNGIIINARDITDRIRLQQNLDEERATRQKEITAAVIEAQEGERAQLALELHDNVNQVLTTIKLYNEMLLEGMGDPKDILTRSVQHLQDCINEIRSISKRLSAPTLGKISLDESLKELVASVNLTNRITIEYNIRGFDTACIHQDLHLAIYRIIQEQLNNVLKYAEAKFVWINLHFTNKQIILYIEDDGKGFNTKQKRTGIGIMNMSSRAEHMGGTFKISSRPGKGCRVRVKFGV